MNRLLYGLAALPFLAGVAMAQGPVQLTNNQMDKVTAGWDLLEEDVTNTSITAVSIYQPPASSGAPPNVITCSGCYLLIQTPSISVASIMLANPLP